MDRKQLISIIKDTERVIRERNELLKEVSSEIGIDISFSDESLMKEIDDLASRRILEVMHKEVEASMKSLLS